jgi:chemotaxis response regulator CheB/chemotaxis methyl-accepting protein methylase
LGQIKTKDQAYVLDAVKNVAEIVTEMAGIRLGPSQYSMIESRLRSRMLRLEIDSFDQYLVYLKANRDSESQALLSLLTTHHSYFFREFAHFEFLLNHGLRNLVEMARSRENKTISIWSAGCSRGQEVYSLAMFFNYHLKILAPDVKFKIWGTDVDPESIAMAQNGVYKFTDVNQAPAMYAAGNWDRGAGAISVFARVKENLKDCCEFHVSSLLNAEEFLGMRQFDLVLCRNVFIYFEPAQIVKVTEKIISNLHPQGFLILGISESLNGMDLKLNPVGPSVYQPLSLLSKIQKRDFGPTDPPVREKVIDVLCVDDSPSVHMLLDKIFEGRSDFHLKGRASNGREALELLRFQKFDVILLDLHMPILDGLGFLKEFRDRNTPVVILSAINRDDESIAQQAINLGAADYIEKPSLNNLGQAGNEIRSKLKIVLKKNHVPVLPPPRSQRFSSAGKSKALRKIKVLIVDDSKTTQNIIPDILSKDLKFELLGIVRRPSHVEAVLKENVPDVMLIQIHMLEMDGVTLLKKIAPLYKIPVVMLSVSNQEQGSIILQALEAGAVDYIQKPLINNTVEVGRLICNRVMAAAEANVNLKSVSVKKVGEFAPMNVSQSLIAIGASTGGTEAIRAVLEGLPSEIPPILIVQHIPPIFSATFAKRLNDLFPFEVKEAEDGDEVTPNRVLVAPGGRQMGIFSDGQRMIIRIKSEDAQYRHRPSVDYLFDSIHRAKIKNVVGIVLTGMGSDGAKGLKALRDEGARTIAQDQASSVVYGMPKEAVEAGGAEFILPLAEMPDKIIKLCKKI